MVDIAAPSDAVRGWPYPSSKSAAPAPGGVAPSLRRRSPAELAVLVEAEIIPRLMLAHRTPERPQADPVGEAALDAFARLTLSASVEVLTAHVEALIRDGLPIEQAHMGLLAPTARRLGDDWVEDEISFIDVSVGLARLQQVVRRLGAHLPPPEAGSGARAACFVTAPGEQHAFGLVLVEDRFRRAGWRTWLDTAATSEDAARAVEGGWFDVFGLSATSDASLAAISATIAAVRRRSLNRDLFVMVGGRLFIEEPELARTVGADAATDTAEDALSVADKAVKRPALA